MNENTYYIYILTNNSNGTLYIGVTNNLVRRIYEHRSKYVDSFSKKYSLKKLVYYEIYDDVQIAIAREKYLKKARRDYKLNLINNFNPEWSDLYHVIIQ